VLRKLTEALAVAHSQITHRDLKPANIFIKNNDISSPIIMDFGLSASTGEGGSHGLTGGTPKYMAPEQLLAPQTVDPRADLFALGIMAYELLTDGEIPACSLRDAAKTGELPRFQPEDVLPPSTFCTALPTELDRLILQMLDHDRDNRRMKSKRSSTASSCATLSSSRAAGKRKLFLPLPCRRELIPSVSARRRRASAIRRSAGSGLTPIASRLRL
jgi:serine/threonine-protein kinase